MGNLEHTNFGYCNEQRSWLHGVTTPESKSRSQDFHSLDGVFVPGRNIDHPALPKVASGWAEYFVQASLHLHELHICFQPQRFPIGTKATIVQKCRQAAP